MKGETDFIIDITAIVASSRNLGRDMQTALAETTARKSFEASPERVGKALRLSRDLGLSDANAAHVFSV